MNSSIASGTAMTSGRPNFWNRFWWKPESPFNLGICRFLFYGLLFQLTLSWHYSAWATVPKSLFRPVWLFERAHLPVLPEGVLLGVEIAWKIALLLSCIGLFTRVSTVVVAICTMYLVGLPYNFGKTDHMTAILVFTTAILAVSRCGDGFSVDALIRRRKDPTPLPPSAEYRWPVRMIWVLMSVLFFNAGMAKVIRGGIPWVFSENMAILLTQRHYQNPNSLPPLSWGLFIAKHPILYMAFAAGAILGECFLFVGLFAPKRLRILFPAALLSMQTGIGLFMRVWFTPFMFVYLFWVPWDEVVGWARARFVAK